MTTALLIFIAVLVAFVAGLVVYLLLQKKQPDPQPALLLQHVETLRTQLSAHLANSTDVIHKQLESMNQNMRGSTGEINQRLDNAARLYASLQSQLGTLAQANQQIQGMMKDVSSLHDILRPPKLRGGMGEVLLENLLRDILPPEHLSIQHRFADGQIVDAAIQTREGWVCVDAKFPLENFRRMLEAADETARREARKEFAKNVRKHIDDIRAKYIRPDEGTLPFALMYIPAENVYYETIIKADEDDEKPLYAYATAKQVMPVSPNSFYAYLVTLAQGFRGLKIEEKTREIIDGLSRLHLELEKFGEDFRKVGFHLSNAQTKFADAEKRLVRFGERLQSTGSASEKELLAIPPQ